MEEEWNAMMEKYKLRDWRYPQQLRQNNTRHSHVGDQDQYQDQDQEAAAAMEDLEKPPYTNAEIVAMAIRNSPQMRCTVQDICTFVEANFPYYRNAAKRKFTSVVYNNSSDFVKTTDYEVGEDGKNRYYYSLSPLGRYGGTAMKKSGMHVKNPETHAYKRRSCCEVKLDYKWTTILAQTKQTRDRFVFPPAHNQSST